MKAIKFVNGFSHDQVLNLEQISSIEIPSSRTGLTLWFGKDHMQITLKSEADRDALFQRICETYGVE